MKQYLEAPQPPKGGATEKAPFRGNGGSVLNSADPAYYEELKRRAEHNRNNPTEAEGIMWGLMSGHKLEGNKFRRQHIIGQFIVDFVCLDKMLIVEIDGGYHNNPTQQKDDKIREEWLKKQGYRIIRFTNEEVIGNTNYVFDTITENLRASQATHPSKGGATEDAPFRGNGGWNGSVVALSAGTAALHLGLVQLGVTAGDEVICQSFTFSASANPIVYQGATPIFIDSEEDTWNMSPVLLEEAIKDRIAKTGKKPKAIIPVHLYGMPAKMDDILEIANRYGIPVLEDAAEALGSRYKGRACGTFGDYAALSFNGNKIITTSGGGALICPTEQAAKRVMFYATQSRDQAPHYQHSHIGYNYRLSNVSAGIGRGQMLVLEQHVARRREINNLYRALLKDVPGLSFQTNPSSDFDSNYWLTSIVIDPEKAGFSREDVRLRMEEENIETRPLWKPMHLQPVFADAPYYGDGTSERLFGDGLCLPSGSTLTDDDIKRVAGIILEMV
ncbi:DegT/DnrJ/EryC1/StrS family aminotransferase [Porphyromonadaceae bacterium W3.11]|nr:DegT/DnrJ/EryC1/StrS family aminotransferase [Porphyromonadaceae bacterium W3.11]